MYMQSMMLILCTLVISCNVSDTKGSELSHLIVFIRQRPGKTQLPCPSGQPFKGLKSQELQVEDLQL